MRSALQFSAFLLGGGILLAGCDGTGTSPDAGSLDEALQARLTEVSQGEGLTFFLLPHADELPEIPQDPRNPLTREKVVLGRLLFHETALMNETRRPEGRFAASCSACHNAAAGFQAGRRQGIGEGGMGFGTRGEMRTRDPAYPLADLDVQPIRSPAPLNAAYQPVMLWNGQFGATGPNRGTEASWTPGTPKEANFLGYEGIETQAIAGLSVHRMGAVASSMASTHPVYRALFEAAFPGAAIDREQAGLAIAAYERTLLADRAPFQRWLRGEAAALTEAQKRGALVFFGKGGCSSCHTGPALSSMSFHALGMGDLEGAGVFLEGGADPSRPEHLGRGGFTGRPQDAYAFKVPQLYNLIEAGPLGHGGTFTTLRAVVEYKNAAVPQNARVPLDRLSPLFVPLGLTATEVDDLVRFLEEGLLDGELDRYVPSELPSGYCFPVNDPRSKVELGC